MASENPFAATKKQLTQCAQLLELDQNTLEALIHPRREIHLSLPVRMDNGQIRVFRGFRVQHNDALGPTKGGIRFHPEETIDTVRALASWMTWKCSVLNLPLGGGKGGIICNPKALSAGELERLSRAYIAQLGNNLGPDKDIPAPDVYTNPQIMAWMMDEYSKLAGSNRFGVITGKPLHLGGSAGRGDATARGGLFAIREAARDIGLNLSGATFAIQGYGNAGYFAASLATKMFGAKIVAVSDSKGAIYNPDGLSPEAVINHKATTGSVAGFPDSQPISNAELLSLPVDVLVPAALENVITGENAHQVQARIVAELANGPTTPEADEILFSNGVHVIPDILCNAGGVTVSYFEMVQNAYGYYWDEARVHKRLDKRMTKSYRQVAAAARKHSTHMRLAAYTVAVSRVLEAMKLRGWL